MREKSFNLIDVIQGCLKDNLNSQRRLYEHFYGYGMHICLCYAKCSEEAAEILNDAFLKVFKSMERYDSAFPFKPWLRKILIHTAIDYHRRNRNLLPTLDLSAAAELVLEEMPYPVLGPDEDVLPILQKLSPAYRLVFNLYVIEKYSHQEIAQMLSIDVRTSRSNFSRACRALRALLEQKTDMAKFN